MHTCALYMRYYIYRSLLVFLNSAHFTCFHCHYLALLSLLVLLKFCSLQCCPVAEPMRNKRIKSITCEADIAGSYARSRNAVQLHENKTPRNLLPMKFFDYLVFRNVRNFIHTVFFTFTVLSIMIISMHQHQNHIYICTVFYD